MNTVSKLDWVLKELKNLLVEHGVTGILVLIIIFICYIAATKPENFKIIFGFIYHILAYPFRFLRKKAIQFQIEGPTTKALKSLSVEVPDIQIPDLSITWVNEENLQSKIDEGKAIIKLKFDNDNTRNILKATNIFVRDAFLLNSKPYLSEQFRKALDLIISKKILLKIKTNQSNLISQFFQENSIDIEEVFDKCEKLEEIDDNGLLTRILLRELNNFGEKLTGRIPKQTYKDEADYFLKFVNDIVTRDYDDYTPLSFINNIIKSNVILVAKKETYLTYGLEPYLRRIKLGRANGIESFYLLARSDKVDILIEIANELLSTGNFILVNHPKVFKDNKNRDSICYFFRINENSLLANTLNEISDSISLKQTIKGVIVGVRKKNLDLNINGVEGIIKNHNLSNIEIDDARMYFKESSYIEAIPIEILQNGIVELSLKNTKSDPNYLVTSKFEIGKKIFGKILYIDDDFIKVELGVEKITGFAYRKDLTKSRFIFLHKKFSLDKEYEFQVLGHNFDKASIRLRLASIQDPWKYFKYSVGGSVKFLVCKRTQRALVGEIEESLEAILPFNELGWTQSEIENKIKEIRLNSLIDCNVKSIDSESKTLILTHKEHHKNPYLKFFKEHQNEIHKFKINEISAYGINGTLLNPELKISIPKFEMSWNNSTYTYSYKVGETKKVFVKDIDKSKTKLIGSFKPILPHPLKDTLINYKIGQIVCNLKIKKTYNWGIVYIMSDNKKTFDGFLSKGDISNFTWIKDCTIFNNSLNNISLEIKSIDINNGKILFTLRNLTKQNFLNLQPHTINYDMTIRGIILGKLTCNIGYSVFLPEHNLEGKFETNNNYTLGMEVKLRAVHISQDEIIFTTDE